MCEHDDFKREGDKCEICPDDTIGNKSASVKGLCVAQCVDCGEQYSGVGNWTEGEWMAKRCLECEGYFKGMLIESYPEQN